MSLTVIEFYYPGDEFGFLSNFYPAEFFEAGTYWRSSEHFYQAMKHHGTELFDEIRAQTTPKEAKELARSVPVTLTVAEKVRIMRPGVWAKFKQNQLLRLALIGTGDAKLVEAPTKDDFWGAGDNGRGINMMGLLLMELRSELKSES